MRHYLLICSVLAFICSLFCGVACTDRVGGVPGFACLLLGWMGFTEWLANPLWLLTLMLVTTKISRYVLVPLAAASVVLALGFLSRTEWMINEAGTMAPIVDVGNGYRLWLGAMILQLSAVVFPRGQQ